MSKNVKIVSYLFIDMAAAVVSWLFGFLLFGISVSDALSYWYYFLINLAVLYSFGNLFGLYSTIWKYAGFMEALKIVLTTGTVLIVNVVISIIAEGLSLSWAILVSTFIFLGLSIPRFLQKFISYFSGYAKVKEASGDATRVMIVGAGSAGAILINEMKTSDKINMFPVCAIDDDKHKIGQMVSGVKVVGDTSEIEKYAEKFKVDEIILAMPAAARKDKTRILNICQKTSCQVKIVPGIYQFASGAVSVSTVKEVSIEDLLGREQVVVNIEEIIGYIKGKTVMVTGGGGSIGSELCRQIAAHDPKKLIILDIYENNAYDIQQELVRRLPDLDLTVLIASVRDKKKIDAIFDKYRPEIIFHAAAHKHVPLMEDSPEEAIKNNVGGTYNVARAAGEYGAEKFIMISTDKAVNPTNVMGATKRICEMIIQTMDKRYKTDYVAVRFGNVLGSNGSVVPLFKRQIAEGGPITVTDKNIIRYFMTIPEAVSLVLQAGAYAKGGEIFVLDMGDPVKIYDLAVNMIKLSNLEPFKDIDIVITGLRKGEKLYEEKLMAEEGLMRTQNNLIHIGKPIKFDESTLLSSVEKLVSSAEKGDSDVKKEIKNLVPNYVIDKRA